MSQQGYSLGRDITITVITGTGQVLNLGKVMKFVSKPDTSNEKVKPINAPIAHLRFWEGWSGNFEVNRTGPDMDAYFAQLEANYFANLDEPAASMQTTIAEPSGGGVSQFRYDGVIMTYTDAGDWAADKTVAQKIDFMAARRVQLA